MRSLLKYLLDRHKNRVIHEAFNGKVTKLNLSLIVLILSFEVVFESRC